MSLTRRDRIALELLGPPLLGGAAAGIWAWATLLQHAVPRPGTFSAFAGHLAALPYSCLVYTLFAFPMIGIQAGCYSAILEWCFSMGLSPRSLRSVALSTALGYLSGLPLALGYGYDRNDTWYFFSVVGPVVGGVIGLIIRRGTPRP
ncbi:MAG TPA: hypothetical protein VG936_18130 [Lacunisphaera sp.]|nr:hypothetical protein [Lacunisphaera sp.]